MCCVESLEIDSSKLIWRKLCLKSWCSNQINNSIGCKIWICLQVGKFLDTLGVWKNCAFSAYIHGRLYYEFNK